LGRNVRRLNKWVWRITWPIKTKFTGEPGYSDFALLAYDYRRKALLFMNNMIKEISTSEVFQLLSKPDTKIIDIRPIDAYNGWYLQNESR